MSDVGSKVGEARTLATGHQVMADYSTRDGDVEFHNIRARVFRELADEIERLSERAALVDELREASRRMMADVADLLKSPDHLRMIIQAGGMDPMDDYGPDSFRQLKAALARADAARGEGG